jgi:glycerol-3-phosphate acyltransferase PlsY
MVLLIGMLLAYLLGSISSAVLVCRAFRYPDPRQGGSKNPGATNVLRLTGSKKAALLTLAGDALKGFLPVVIMLAWGADTTTTAWVLLAAFLGHLFPCFFGFVGGKGVATALGGLIALSLPLGGLVILTWGIAFLFFRISALSALSAFVGLPIYAYLVFHALAPSVPLFILSILLIVRHKDNIQRLLLGVE